METPSPPLTDSPWFWLLLFGTMALIMLAAIEPKFARRQERLERMHASRQSGRPIEHGGPLSKQTDSERMHAPQWQPARRVSLRPLMLFLSSVMAGGIIAMYLRRRTIARRATDGANHGGTQT